MDCANCPLSKFTVGDKGVSIRRQEEFTNDLRFVMSHPMPSFVGWAKNPTTATFDRFVSIPYDIVFTKNCLQANRIEEAKGKTALERNARACCESTLKEDLKGAKVIVACGNEALEALGYKYKAGNCVGWVDWNEELQASVLACLDVHKVEDNSDALGKDWAWTVQKAQLIAQDLAPKRNETPEPKWVVANTGGELRELTKNYPTGEHMVLDIETTGLDPRKDKILQVGIYNPISDPIIIPVEAFGSDDDLVNCFIELLDRMLVVTHNGKFDAKFIEEELGIEVPLDDDTLVIHHMIDERTGTHGLKRIIRVYLNWGFYDEHIDAYYKMEGGLANAPFEEVADYLSLDLMGTFGVLQQELHLLRDDRNNKKFPWRIELSQRDHITKILNPVNNELKRVEKIGFRVDEDRLNELIDEARPSVAAKKKAIEDYFFNELGEEFNVDSPVQLLTALHGVGALRKDIDTTEAKVLKDFINVPIIKDILEYKKEYKVLNAFYLSIKDKLVLTKWGKKVFATFNLAGTIGSRWSANNPNLQQAPRAPHPFKSIFIPNNEGYIIFQNDFSALEVCMAAYLSRDTALAEAYKGDMHTTVSKAAFKKYFDEMEQLVSTEEMKDFLDRHSIMMAAKKAIEKVEQKDGPMSVNELKENVTKHLRYCAKVITFGIFYGRGARALAEQELSCSEHEAEVFIENYFKLFPGLDKFIKKVHYIVKDVGYIISPDGRMRDVRFWKLSSDERKRNRAYARACRQVVNFLMQNFAGTINNIAFIKGAKYLTENDCGAMLAAVHDSSVGEIRFDPSCEVHLNNIREAQEGILVDDLVKLGVETEVGFNWGELYPQHLFFAGCGELALKLGIQKLGVPAIKERLDLYVEAYKIKKDLSNGVKRDDADKLPQLEKRIEDIDNEWSLMLVGCN